MRVMLTDDKGHLYPYGKTKMEEVVDLNPNTSKHEKRLIENRQVSSFSTNDNVELNIPDEIVPSLIDQLCERAKTYESSTHYRRSELASWR